MLIAMDEWAVCCDLHFSSFVKLVRRRHTPRYFIRMQIVLLSHPFPCSSTSRHNTYQYPWINPWHLALSRICETKHGTTLLKPVKQLMVTLFHNYTRWPNQWMCHSGPPGWTTQRHPPHSPCSCDYLCRWGLYIGLCMKVVTQVNKWRYLWGLYSALQSFKCLCRVCGENCVHTQTHINFRLHHKLFKPRKLLSLVSEKYNWSENSALD